MAKAALTGVYIGVSSMVVFAIAAAVMIWNGRRGHEKLDDFAPPGDAGDYSAYDNLLTEYTFND